MCHEFAMRADMLLDATIQLQRPPTYILTVASRHEIWKPFLTKAREACLKVYRGSGSVCSTQDFNISWTFKRHLSVTSVLTMSMSEKLRESNQWWREEHKTDTREVDWNRKGSQTLNPFFFLISIFRFHFRISHHVPDVWLLFFLELFVNGLHPTPQKKLCTKRTVSAARATENKLCAAVALVEGRLAPHPTMEMAYKSICVLQRALIPTDLLSTAGPTQTIQQWRWGRGRHRETNGETSRATKQH